MVALNNSTARNTKHAATAAAAAAHHVCADAVVSVVHADRTGERGALGKVQLLCAVAQPRMHGRVLAQLHELDGSVARWCTGRLQQVHSYGSVAGWCNGRCLQLFSCLITCSSGISLQGSSSSSSNSSSSANNIRMIQGNESVCDKVSELIAVLVESMNARST
jgi:hypothetical protein